MKNKLCWMLLIVIICLLCACVPEKSNYYIFSDITECEKIYLSNDAEVTKIVDASKDGYLSNIKYDSFCGIDYSSKDVNFELYAYVFNESSLAQQYFEYVSVRKSERETNFFCSGGMIYYNLVVIHHEKAYLIKTYQGDIEKVQKLISTVFNEELEF